MRELAKHKDIEEIILCEIDQMVVDVSKKHFPQIASALGHEKVKVRIGDGIAYMKELENEVDVVIVDSTDPIGPGEGLFTGEFYKSVRKALRPDGIMVAQSESLGMKKKSCKRFIRTFLKASVMFFLILVACQLIQEGCGLGH